MNTIDLPFDPNEPDDINAAVARAHQLRAETMRGYRTQFTAWLKTFNVGFAARTAH
jgi:hypothetical protein